MFWAPRLPPWIAPRLITSGLRLYTFSIPDRTSDPFLSHVPPKKETAASAPPRVPVSDGVRSCRSQQKGQVTQPNKHGTRPESSERVKDTDPVSEL